MDTNPAQDVPQSAESQLEAIFAKKFGEAPAAEPEDDTADEVDDTPEVEASADEDESEADTGQSEATDTDEIEIPVGGEVKRLKKAELAEIVAKRDSFQADYTRKTQEVAEQRKAVQDRAQYLEVREQLMQSAFKEAAEVESLQSQLTEFDSLNWNDLIATDPQKALQLNLARQQLQTRLGQKQAALQEITARNQQAAELHKRRQMEMGQAELSRRIGKLDDPTRAQLMEAAKELQFTDAEMMSPAALHALHLASKYLALQKSKPLTEKRVAQAKPMQAPAARSGTQTVEHAKRDALKARLHKTGRREDAEAYLTRVFESKRKR